MRIKAGKFQKLYVHFTKNFFYSSTLNMQDSFQSRLISLLTILAFTGGIISYNKMFPFILWRLTGLTFNDFWYVKITLTGYSMIVAGIIATVKWEQSYLSESDRKVLDPLPVKKSTILSTKFLSLMGYVALITVTFNILSLTIFWVAMADMVDKSHIPAGTFLCGIFHLLTSLAASLAVFMFIAFIYRVIQIIMPNTGRKIITLLQGLFTAFFASGLFWTGYVEKEFYRFRGTESLMQNLYPPAWFSGTYMKLCGLENSVYSSHSDRALLCLQIVALMYVLLLISSAFINTVETFKAPTFTNRFRFFRKIINRTILRSREETGLFWFIHASFFRLPGVKPVMGSIAALPLGYILSRIVQQKDSSEFSLLFASLPLIFSASMAIGFKASLSKQVNGDARWIFKILPAFTSLTINRTLRKFFYIYLLFPSLLPTFFILNNFFATTSVLLHLLYALIISAIIYETIFINYSFHPYVTEPSPGKYDLKLTMPLWITGGVLYYNIFSWGGVLLYNNSEYYPVFFIWSGLIYLSLRFINYKRASERTPLFEQQEEFVMVSLFDNQGG